ncbi:MAG: hypothetical protein ACJASM_001521 [Salibacteraceae bacterium]
MGDTLWTVQYLDSNKMVAARTLIETPDSGFFLIGDETKSLTNRDPIVFRVDKKGKLLSSHSIAHRGVGVIFSVVKHSNGK